MQLCAGSTSLGSDSPISFRKTSQKHAVLLKNRELVHERIKPEEATSAPIDADVEPEAGRSSSTTKRRRRRDGQTSSPQPLTDEDEVDELESPVERRKRRRDRSPEVAVKAEEPEAAELLASSHVSTGAGGETDPLLVPDEDEKEFKPRLKVSYAGFSIFGRTLVVVVEPYPPLRETPAPEPVRPQEVRELSVLPSDRDRSRSASAMPAPAATGRASSRRRSGTPLFRAETPSSVMGDEEDELPKLDSRGLPPDAYRHLRARSQSLAHDPFDVDDEDADLPDPDDPFGRKLARTAPDALL